MESTEINWTAQEHSPVPQEGTPGKNRFLAPPRICLSSWHYISRRTFSFNRNIDLFTGHSGSGKSTVTDAIQIFLYVSTDGHGFFNKVTAGDSDRNPIEYPRGMANTGNNSEFSHLGNQNFSSTIMLELEHSGTGECQCVGIVFDAETATNDTSRRFFQHRSSVRGSEHRTGKRTMSIAGVESYFQSHYNKKECFVTSYNERFRRILYGTCLGGLSPEKFPLLFRRAIPFRMSIELEDFVEEYICMEMDIHIEDV